MNWEYFCLCIYLAFHFTDKEAYSDIWLISHHTHYREVSLIYIFKYPFVLHLIFLRGCENKNVYNIPKVLLIICGDYNNLRSI